MELFYVAIGLFLLLTLMIWGYRFGDRLLDAFSPVVSRLGVIIEKQYEPPRLEIVTKRVVRTHEHFSSTSYDTLEEVQMPEKYTLDLQVDNRTIVAPVSSKVYDRVRQGDSVLGTYAQGRFSQKVYIKRIKYL